MRLAIVVTREVFPEPGMPPTAIMRRLVGGVERCFAGRKGRERLVLFN